MEYADDGFRLRKAQSYITILLKNLAAINILYMSFLCNSQVDRKRDVTSTAIHLTVPGIAGRRNRAERLISRRIVHRPLTTVEFKLLQVAV